MGPRVRKSHVRSRTGCATCRKRHVRCDGNRPSCLRCTRAERTCEFRSPSPPLRDRRAVCLPGEQQPWAVQPVRTERSSTKALMLSIPRPMSEMNCRGAPMSYRSRELLHYFYQASGDLCTVPRLLMKDLSATITLHPDALQTALIFAGLHYSWAVGDIRKYEATFLFHKFRTICSLNNGIGNIRKSGLMACIRQVSMLCLIECSLSNVSAAETHLDGLITMIDLLFPLQGTTDNCNEVDKELALRYLIMAHDSVQGGRGRCGGSHTLRSIFRGNDETGFHAFVSLVRHWDTQNIGCLQMLLDAMALMPFVFVGRPKGTTFSDIDGSLFAQYLRNMTTSTELTHSEDAHVPCEPSWVWMEGSASRLHHATISSHITSLISSNALATPGAATSWSSMCIASQLYSHSVLGLFGRNEPLDWRLLRRYLALLAQDIDKDSGKMRANPSDIGLWKGFVGAYTIATHQTLNVCDRFLEEIENTFNEFICRWAVATGVSTWDEVHPRLANTAWPSNMPQDLGAEVWMRATQH